MGFKALFDREDVLSVLTDTLIDFYSAQYPDKDIYIGYEKRENAAEYIMVPILGMIMQAFPCKKVRKHYYDSYNIRNNTAKRIAAKLLVFAATHTKSILSMKERLYIYPADIVNKNTVFSYCNRSVRIFNFAYNTTFSIQKHGFTDKFFANQLEFRLKYKYDFIPPIVANGKTWFEENILDGCMMARISDKAKYDTAQNKALAAMEQIRKDTLEYILGKEYVACIGKHIFEMLEAAHKNKNIKTYDYARSYCEMLVKSLEGADKLPVMISHGDLQGGNIMTEGDKLWIIDWETQAQRSCWFDTITLLFSTRYYGGIHDLYNKVMEKSLFDYIEKYPNWSEKQVLAVFLLEDIEFYLEDMMELSGNSGADSFDNYINECSETDWKKCFESE